MARYTLIAAALVSLASAGFGQTGDSTPISLNPVVQAVVETRLRAYTRKNPQREPALRALFEDAGCKGDALSEAPAKGVKVPNLVCDLRGSTEEKIVVGAHFDLVEAGNGVVDNWSGAALLASLYQGLAGALRKHTFEFVGFTREESGLLGSKAFVKDIGPRRQEFKAMINIDSVGLTETKVWESHADKELIRWLVATAKASDLPLAGVNVDEVGSSDSEPFREAKIPALTLHSVTQGTLGILHSPEDKIEKIQLDPYYRTYRLILAYLAVLDQKLE